MNVATFEADSMSGLQSKVERFLKAEDKKAISVSITTSGGKFYCMIDYS